MIPRKVGTHVGQKAGDQELAGPLTSCVALGKPFNICSSTLCFHHVSTSHTDLIYLSKFKSPVPLTMAAQAGIHPHGLLLWKITHIETTENSGRKQGRKIHSFNPVSRSTAHNCSHLACLNGNHLQVAKMLNLESEIRSSIFKREIKDLEQTTRDLFYYTWIMAGIITRSSSVFLWIG